MGYYERKVARLLTACLQANAEEIKAAMKDSRTLFDSNYVEPANINSRNQQQNTALMVAIGTGNRDIVKLVLSYKPDVNLKNTAGETALMHAAKLGLKDILSDLIEAGARIDETNHKGETALMYAVEAKQGQSTLFLLSKKAAVNDPCNAGATVLMRAAAAGDSVSVRALLDADAAIDAIDNECKTALMYAAIARMRNTLGDLLDRGANTELRDNRQKTAADYGGWWSGIQDDIALHINNKAMAAAEAKELAEKQQAEVAVQQAAAAPRDEKIRSFMNAEGLDPAECEHWLPIGKAAIEYVMAGTDSPKLLSNTFNFSARQYVTVTKNMLTGEKAAEVAGALDAFPNQDLVAEAHAKLVQLGKAPPAWERKGRIKEL